ncbi:MAG: helix-turn-helix transcriptional regulator [Patescibacteria group bacterium]
MRIEELEKKLFGNKPHKIDEIDLALIVGQKALEARTIAGLTQAELARRLKTKQPSIARLEGGNTVPSLSSLLKISEALGTELIPPNFKSVIERENAPMDSISYTNTTVYSLHNRIESYHTINPTTNDFLSNPLANQVQQPELKVSAVDTVTV